MKKRVTVTHFTMKIILRTCTQPVIRKFYLLKIYWPIVGIHRLLHSSSCFLNKNTAITRQQIGTAMTLDVEWWQVCGEAWVRGQRKTGQVLGAFGTYEPFISLIFQFFRLSAVNRGYGVRMYLF
jgi:hypothetical protein